LINGVVLALGVAGINVGLTAFVLSRFSTSHRFSSLAQVLVFFVHTVLVLGVATFLIGRRASPLGVVFFIVFVVVLQTAGQVILISRKKAG